LAATRSLSPHDQLKGRGRFGGTDHPHRNRSLEPARKDAQRSGLTIIFPRLHGVHPEEIHPESGELTVNLALQEPAETGPRWLEQPAVGLPGAPLSRRGSRPEDMHRNLLNLDWGLRTKFSPNHDLKYLGTPRSNWRSERSSSPAYSGRVIYSTAARVPSVEVEASSIMYPMPWSPGKRAISA